MSAVHMSAPLFYKVDKNVFHATSKLVRNVVATSSLLDLASLAIFRIAEKSGNDHAWESAARIARVVNRAAHHSMANALTASANLDLIRRDACLRSTSLKPHHSLALRMTPFGSPLLFGGKIEEIRRQASKELPLQFAAQPSPAFQRIQPLPHRREARRIGEKRSFPSNMPNAGRQQSKPARRRPYRGDKKPSFSAFKPPNSRR